MLMVKDSMVLIHLAKISVLAACCTFFGDIAIPQRVWEETVQAGKLKGFADSFLIEQMVKGKKIRVTRVRQRHLIQKANAFNIFGGEAEALALYWQEKADWLATDDDNVRSKKEVLGLRLIGTPAILLMLYEKKKISLEKFEQGIQKLRKIGWFSNEVLDKLLLEVKKNG